MIFVKLSIFWLFWGLIYIKTGSVNAQSCSKMRSPSPSSSSNCPPWIAHHSPPKMTSTKATESGMSKNKMSMACGLGVWCVWGVCGVEGLVSMRVQGWTLSRRCVAWRLGIGPGVMRVRSLANWEA